MSLETEYNGYTIKWTDFDCFSIIIEGTTIKKGLRTVGDCEKFIDVKSKEKFKRVKCFAVVDWNGGRVPCEATSIADPGEVWVSDGKKRRKIAARNVWLDTPENRDRISTIAALEKQRAEINEQIENIESEAASLTTDMLLETKK